MKRIIYLGLIIGILGIILPASAVSKATAKVYQWKMQTYVPEPGNIYQGYMLPFVEEIAKRTGGRIQITPYPANAIVASTELLVATAEGVIECAVSTTGYDTGIIPEAYVPTNMPYGWTETSQPLDFWYNNQEAWNIVDTAYRKKNIKLVALLNHDDPMTFLTTFPVQSVSDFKGKIIRSSGNWAPMVSALGASQVNMSIVDVYHSLEKGVIDGVFMAVSGLSDFKWDEVIQYVLMPYAMVGGGVDVIVNLDAFNDLTPELQKIFVDTAREVNITHLIPYSRDITEKSIAAAKAKGVSFNRLPDAEVKKMHLAALEMWKKIASLNANTARQMELMRKYLDEKGIDYPGK